MIRPYLRLGFGKLISRDSPVFQFVALTFLKQRLVNVSHCNNNLVYSVFGKHCGRKDVKKSREASPTKLRLLLRMVGANSAHLYIISHQTAAWPQGLRRSARQRYKYVIGQWSRGSWYIEFSTHVVHGSLHIFVSSPVVTVDPSCCAAPSQIIYESPCPFVQSASKGSQTTFLHPSSSSVIHDHPNHFFSRCFPTSGWVNSYYNFCHSWWGPSQQLAGLI